MMDTEPLQTTFYTFAVIGFVKAMYDISIALCARDTLVDQLTEIKSELVNIRLTLEEIQNKSDTQSTNQSEPEEVEQYQIPPPNMIEEQPEQPEQQEQKQEDKHDVIRRLIKEGTELYCTYKSTTLMGTFHLKESAPHGYVIRDSLDVEYDTPTHFSFTKKRLINPKIHSDNGWDSVYIHSGTNKKGEPKKVTLKTLVDPL
jgi:hypothetical protein